MPKMSKQKITLIIILVSLALIFGIKMSKQTIYPKNQLNIPAQVNGSEKAPLDSDKVKGSENASLKIIEYVDFQCPSCAHGAEFIKNYMATNLGNVQLELKYFPLDMHQHSLAASRYAECASRQGKFWEFQDLVFELQDKWKSLVDATPTFDAISQEIGLDLVQVKTCLLDENVDRIIEQHKAEGKQQGVKSTPSYFINGKMVVGTKSLEQELNRSMMAGGNTAIGQGSAKAMLNELQSTDPRLKASYVCMGDDNYLGRELVPIVFNGKTYYGCCQNCAAKLNSEAARYAPDPLTGEAVDKADAYIVLKPDGSKGVLYFKSSENYMKYMEENTTQ